MRGEFALRQKLVKARGRNERRHAFDAKAGGLVQASVDVEKLRHLIGLQPQHFDTVQILAAGGIGKQRHLTPVEFTPDRIFIEGVVIETIRAGQLSGVAAFLGHRLILPRTVLLLPL